MSILEERYVSAKMKALFDFSYRMRVWRDLWIALAKSEKACGLPITDAQIHELESHRDRIDLDRIHELDATLKHDVMAAIHAYAELCPTAGAIIHLGATSCFVTDNADLLIMREALTVIRRKIVSVVKVLRALCDQYKALPCLSYTHFQPAQPTTVGKRIAVWLFDLITDFENLSQLTRDMKFRGVKGTTGTQASFLKLFEGDDDKVVALDRLVANHFGFEHTYPVTSQVYSRKLDGFILHGLAQIGVSASKIATDIRLLANFEEIQEPFSDRQVGSSAMPYKRNPMLSERICALSKVLLSLAQTPLMTAATQWLERSLDDSAARRIAISDAFYLADSILDLLSRVVTGLVINDAVIQRRLDIYLPFMVSENILMAAVKKGGDRQFLHERIREISVLMKSEMIRDGAPNTLLERIAADPSFGLSEAEVNQLAKENISGCAATQCESFVQDVVDPMIEKYIKEV